MKKWKQVPVDTSELDPTELEQFGGIEELSDYEILRPGFETSGKKKKLKKKKEKNKRTEEEILIPSRKAKKSKLAMKSCKAKKEIAHKDLEILKHEAQHFVLNLVKKFCRNLHQIIN